jgi:hypothetical protein
MSTRNVLAWGERFTLWKECMETDDSVYLTVTCCEACGSSQTVKVPVDVWETVRTLPSVSFAVADLTDEAIRERVEAEIAEWCADVAEHTTAVAAVPPEDTEKREWKMKCLAFIEYHPTFRLISDAPEEHRRRGFIYYAEERSKLLGIRERMAKHTAHKPDGDT